MGGPDLLSREEWETAVQRRLGRSDFELSGWNVRPLGEDGAGFLGDHYLADVTVRLRDSPTSAPPLVLHYFFKTMPDKRDYQRIICEVTNGFQKEVDALSILFRDMRSALVDDGKDMRWTCDCFYTRPDLILLEDLTEKGFVMFPSRVPLGYQHCAAVLRALANLHSASVIFEETRPKQPFRIGTEYAEVMQESFFRHAPHQPGHPGTSWLHTSARATLAILGENHDEEALKKMEDDVLLAFNHMFELEKPSSKFRNVVCQGDMWANNIFYRLEAEEVVESRLVDFQLIRYVPPANEIMCFLHLTTNREFRAQYESELLALYYAHFSKNLKQHGLDPSHLLPWNTFKESCDYYKTIGVIKATSYSSIILMEKEYMESIFDSSESFERFFSWDRRKEVLCSYRKDDVYRGKIDEVIEEFLQECLINKRHLRP